MKSILEKLNKNLPLTVYRLPEGEEFMFNHHLLDVHHSGVLKFPGEKFEFSTNPLECDLIAFLPCEDSVKEQYNFFKKNFNGQGILLLKLYHVSECSIIIDTLNRYKSEFHEFADRIIPVHMELNSTEGVYYDWLWNQEKAAFVDTKLYVDLYKTTNEATGVDMFELDTITVPNGKNKILCVNRIRYEDYSDRSVKRLALNTFLKRKEGALVNDPEMGNRFLSQEDIVIPEVGFGSFHPLHNLYYRSSYVSVFVETLTHVNTNDNSVTRCVTEKTFNPLIKGHYILPFGYFGLIKDIRSYGFNLPEWIDYSYDDIWDTNLRFWHYMKSVEAVLDYPVPYLQKLFRRDIAMLMKNRELFFTKPYSNMYSGIRVYLQKIVNDNEQNVVMEKTDDNNNKKRLI